MTNTKDDDDGQSQGYGILPTGELKRIIYVKHKMKNKI